MSGQLVFTGIV